MNTLPNWLRRLRWFLMPVAALWLVASWSSFGAEQPMDPSASPKSGLARVFTALRSQRFDPADPTQISTSAGVAGVFNTFRNPQGKGLTYGLEVNLEYVMSALDDYSLGLDLPFLRSDLPGLERQFGIGDLTINNLYVPYRSTASSTGLLGLGFQLPVTAPSGSYRAGLGEGNWSLAPGVLAGFKWKGLRLFPIAGYRFPIEGEGEIGRDRTPLFEGPSFDLLLAGGLPDPWYSVLTPGYTYNNRADTDAHSLTLNLQIGRMLGAKFNQTLGLSITHELLDRPGALLNLRLYYTYYY